jgi:hypothetical protein
VLLRALRSTGFDPPFGDPAGAHPGVRLESHFWRLVDDASGLVVLAFATAARDPGGAPWTSVALAARLPDGRRTLAEHAAPGLEASERGLELRAPDGSFAADAHGLAVRLPTGETLDARLRDARPWSRRVLGGLGLGHVVPGLTQYWHPHLLGARVAGSARVDGGATALDLSGASAYGEKNWGRGGIPPAWWWGQAFVPQADAALAFAGGLLDFRAFTWRATALAVRLGDDLHAWAPPQLLRTRVDTRRWRIDARDARIRVAVEAVAPGAALDLPVPVPGEHRTELLSHQHQDGRLRLTVWRGGRPVLRESTHLAGLERGGRLLPRAKVLRTGAG